MRVIENNVLPDFCIVLRLFHYTDSDFLRLIFLSNDPIVSGKKTSINPEIYVYSPNCFVCFYDHSFITFW